MPHAGQNKAGEVLTWAQLGMHRKPIGLLNVDRYYDPLLAFVERSISDGIADPAHRRLLIEATEPRELLKKISREATGGAASVGLKVN